MDNKKKHKKIRSQKQVQRIKNSHLVIGGIGLIFFALFVPPKGMKEPVVNLLITNPKDALPLIFVVSIGFPCLLLLNWFVNKSSK